MRKNKTSIIALAFASALGFACITPASAVTCFSTSFPLGGFNGTGSTCPADTIFTNTPDPTSNSAPNLQNQTLNGSPLLASLNGAATLNGFTVTVTSRNGGDALAGAWSFSPPTSTSLFPKFVEINAGSSWFFTETLGATSGTWSTCPSGLGGSLCLQNPPGNSALGLSHIAFFDGVGSGRGNPPGGVPIPAALPLFASGASFLGWFGWRRKKKAAHPRLAQQTTAE
jgi:hypothetical protein